jgi:hypothetical protein
MDERPTDHLIRKITFQYFYRNPYRWDPIKLIWHYPIYFGKEDTIKNINKNN